MTQGREGGRREREGEGEGEREGEREREREREREYCVQVEGRGTCMYWRKSARKF